MRNTIQAFALLATLFVGAVATASTDPIWTDDVSAAELAADAAKTAIARVEDCHGLSGLQDFLAHGAKRSAKEEAADTKAVDILADNLGEARRDPKAIADVYFHMARQELYYLQQAGTDQRFTSPSKEDEAQIKADLEAIHRVQDDVKDFLKVTQERYCGNGVEK